MPARTLPRAVHAPVLLLVLAITTGWMDADPGHLRLPAGPAARGVVGDTAPAGLRRNERPEPFGSDDALPSGASGYSSVIFWYERGAELAVDPVMAPTPVKVAAPAPPGATHAGENRFWIPSLGIGRRVRPFACSRQRPPDNYIYRWGCAGRKNVYIMGHAHSVMKPLHDAYVRGKLRVGMVAIYANANGKLTRYRVTEWRVLDPADSHWAIADQPVRSMTLQTCVGTDGQYRLAVRLVAVD